MASASICFFMKDADAVKDADQCKRTFSQLCHRTLIKNKNLPYVITVNPWYEDLPLVIIDK